MDKEVTQIKTTTRMMNVLAKFSQQKVKTETKAA
jgi:hypothetical protein